MRNPSSGARALTCFQCRNLICIHLTVIGTAFVDRFVFERIYASPKLTFVTRSSKAFVSPYTAHLWRAMFPHEPVLEMAPRRSGSVRWAATRRSLLRPAQCLRAEIYTCSDATSPTTTFSPTSCILYYHS